MQDEPIQKLEDDLQIWLDLQTSASADCRTAENPAGLPTADETRLASVGRCLRLLDALWSDRESCDSQKAAEDETPQEYGVSFDFADLAFTGFGHEDTRRKRFGRFLIGERLGRGGHNFVYRAHDPFLNRDVALKIPRPDSLASAELRRRFVDEAQVLARLRHPNLAAILEAGTVGPVCYLAMSYCPGPSLAEWILRHEEPVPFDLAARLVRDLAVTVDYVHSRGILHRDIKPSNVLLEPVETGPGKYGGGFAFTPKLTDFGLARLTECPQEHTATGAVLGTPAYMAPEQAEGRQCDIGVATDVYALGATLYELVTGRPPFRGDSELQTLRLVTEGRLLPPRRLRANTPPELDAICSKCLETEPNRRYHSARDLADDLTALLEQRPVQARPCGPFRRAVKWCRRRPLVAALSALVCLSMAMGLGAAGWQWLRAESHRETAEANFLLAHRAVKEFHELLLHGTKYDARELLPLRDEVLKTALPYYDRLLAQRTSSPAIRADIADVYRQLGHVALSDDRWEKALDLYRKAADLLRELAREEPANNQHREFLARSCQRIGSILHQVAKSAEAIEWLEEAVAIQRQLVNSHPQRMGPKTALAETLISLIPVHLARDDLKTAAELADKSIELCRHVPSQSDMPASTIQRYLADAYATSAQVRRTAGDVQGAIEAYRRAIELQQQLMDQNLEMPTAASQLASYLALLANLHAGAGDDTQAVEQFGRAIEVLEMLVHRYPSASGYQRKLADAADDFAQHHRSQGRLEVALKLHQQATQLWEPIMEVRPENARLRFNLMRSYHRMAKIHLAQRRLDEASAAVDRGIEVSLNRPQKAVGVLAENQDVPINAMHDRLTEIKTKLAAEGLPR
jgi:tetratricopeptide (TPR) repeat protein/tRNA A-37 threonylcarbamoyl transferase component Bud32